MILPVVLLALIIALMPFTTVAADETDNGIIQGHVINGTEDGATSVAGVDVTLSSLDHADVLDTTTVQTDPDGLFTFNSLSTVTDAIYILSLTFLDVEYTTGYIVFEADETSITIDMDVYEVSDSASDLYIVQSSTAVYTETVMEGDPLLVLEYYLIANTSDKVYIGTEEGPTDGSKVTLKFTVPAGATDLSYDQGLVDGFVFETDDGFISTMPVIPGHARIGFSYYLAPDGSVLDISRKFNYPLMGYHTLAVQDSGSIRVSAEQLELGESVEVSGDTFLRYEGQNFTADTVVIASINLAWTSSQASVIWFTVALVIVAAGIGGGYVYKKRRSSRLATIPIVSSHIAGDDRQKLLLEIAQMDDQFAEGNISKQEYDKLRSEKKEQLAELMREAKADAYGE